MAERQHSLTLENAVYDDQFEITIDDLSYLISPDGNDKMRISPGAMSTGSGKISSFAPGSGNSQKGEEGPSSKSGAPQPKVSPLLTDEYSTDGSHPSLSSVRGLDANNQPIYSSSQTPHGFNVMTKRKGPKKSVFNFEGLDHVITAQSDKPSPSISNPTGKETAEESNNDNEPSSPEDSPESISRRFLRTRARGTRAAVGGAFELGNGDGLTPPNPNAAPVKVKDEILDEIDAQKVVDYNGSDESSSSDQEMDNDDLKPVKEGLDESLALDTKYFEEDPAWSGLNTDTIMTLLPSPMPTPTITNPRKKQDGGGEHGIAMMEQQPPAPPQPPQQFAQQNMQQQQQQQNFAQPQQQVYSPDYYQQNMNYNQMPNNGGMMYNPNPQQMNQMPYQQQMNQYNMNMQPNNMNYPMALPSISVLQANSQVLGPYGAPYPMQQGNGSPVQMGGFANNMGMQMPLQPNGMPMNSMSDIANYQNMAQRKVHEMKMQQSYPAYGNVNMMQIPYNQPLLQNQQPMNSSGNTATMMKLAGSSGGRKGKKNHNLSKYNNNNNDSSGNMSVSSVTSASDTDQLDDDGPGSGGKKSSPLNTSSRASKSLAEISKRFVTLYGKDNTMDYISGLTDPDDVTDAPLELHRVDGAAEALSVHVRRIYELIKILEILSLVTFAGDKRGKFSWRGTKNFLYTLGNIQNDGIANFPQLAQQNGLTSITVLEQSVPKTDSTGTFDLSLSQDDSLTFPNPFSRGPSGVEDNKELFSEFLDLDNLQSLELFNMIPEEGGSGKSTGKLGSQAINAQQHNMSQLGIERPIAGSAVAAGHEEHFMVEIICRRFLQLFLVGMNSLSMSSAIQKLIPMEENMTLSDYNKVNATKIRRVYDVTNVLCSLNLIRKKTIPKSKAMQAEMENNIDSQGTDLHDLDDASLASNMGKKGAGAAMKGPAATAAVAAAGNKGAVSDRADTKVLEWTSFAPKIIRQKYVARLQAELRSQQAK